jgi:hypothetical protein
MIGVFPWNNWLYQTDGTTILFDQIETSLSGPFSWIDSTPMVFLLLVCFVGSLCGVLPSTCDISCFFPTGKLQFRLAIRFPRTFLGKD